MRSRPRFASSRRGASRARSSGRRAVARGMRARPRRGRRSSRRRSRAGSPTSSPSSGSRRRARGRPGGSPCARAPRARTARSSRWRGSPRRGSACAGRATSADAVRAVWASLASGRALAYLAAHGVRDVGMAVVIQRVVEAEAAGVMFTRAPDARVRTDGRADRQRGLRARLAGRRRRDDAGHAPRRPARARASRRSSRTRSARRSSAPTGPPRSTSPTPTRPRSTPRGSPTLAEIARAPREARARSPGTSSSRATARHVWLVQARPATGRGFPEGGDARDRLEQRQRRRGAPRRRHAAHLVGRRRVQRGRASAARSPRSGAPFRATRASSATSTGAST